MQEEVSAFRIKNNLVEPTVEGELLRQKLNDYEEDEISERREFTLENKIK